MSNTPTPKGTHGGKRPGAGRQPRTEQSPQELLKAALAVACPATEREQIVTALVNKAAKGDIPAARIILAYTFGQPANGDDIAVEREVNKIAEEFYRRLEPIYGDAETRKILSLIGGQPADDKPTKKTKTSA